MFAARSPAGDELYQKGNASYAKHNIADAICMWSEAVESYHHPEACMALGRCYDFGEGTKADQTKYVTPPSSHLIFLPFPSLLSLLLRFLSFLYLICPSNINSDTTEPLHCTNKQLNLDVRVECTTWVLAYD